MPPMFSNSAGLDIGKAGPNRSSASLPVSDVGSYRKGLDETAEKNRVKP